MTEQPGSDAETDLRTGLQAGDPDAEETVRTGDLTAEERGLGPDTLDQEATVEAQRDSLERERT